MDIASSDFYLNVIGMEGDCQDIYRINLVEGEYPKNEKEIVLDYRFRDYIDNYSKVGDEVELEILSRETLQNEQIKYKICGFFIPENNGGYELYGFMNLEGADRALKKQRMRAFMLLWFAQRIQLLKYFLRWFLTGLNMYVTTN